MQLFISGTDTNVGKTLVCSWLCWHTRYSYFKPIQTGGFEVKDSTVVARLTGALIYPEKYLYHAAVSPHLAAALENEVIDLKTITLPDDKNLIVEGAGGLLVPISKKYLMIDLIKYLKIPVILVTRSNLGTINHTLLSVQALKARNILTLGIIMNGDINEDNKQAIEFYGKVKVLAQIPFMGEVDENFLSQFPLTEELQKVLSNQ